MSPLEEAVQAALDHTEGDCDLDDGLFCAVENFRAKDIAVESTEEIIDEYGADRARAHIELGGIYLPPESDSWQRRVALARSRICMWHGVAAQACAGWSVS